MDFRLSDEQEAIAGLAADLFAGDGDAPPAWQQLEDAGLTQLLLPAAQGGSELGMVELALVLIEQGRGLVTVPLWRSALAALAMGTAERAPALATEAMVAATRTEQGWQLRGRVVAVPGLAGASSLVLTARDGDRDAVFVLDPQAPGVTRTNGVLTDGEAANDLVLDDVPGRELAVGPAWLHARVAACVSALTVGVARGALERTAAYVGTRQQFGRPIGSFQAVAQRLADAFSDVEVAQTLAIELAWTIDVGAEIGSTADVTAYWAAQCGHRVAHAAMHLHGGIGADTSYPIHRVLLQSRALELVLGGARRQIARIGERLAA